MKVEMIEVIKTETVEGKGTKEDPVTVMIRYWAKDGTMIAEQKKVTC